MEVHEGGADQKNEDCQEESESLEDRTSRFLYTSHR